MNVCSGGKMHFLKKNRGLTVLVQRVICRGENVNQIKYRSERRARYVNTLWTGDADLRLYISTVQDG